MSTTVIVLIVIGLIFIFVSFALSEKLSEEKEESAGVVKIPKELTQEQKEKIDTLIRDYMDQQVDGKLADIETRLAEIVNQKTLALGDYAVSVNEEIDRNHKEVVFLYDMLSDKQKEIMTTVNMIDGAGTGGTEHCQGQPECTDAGCRTRDTGTGTARGTAGNGC